MADEHTLEFLLAFDGRVRWLEQGYSLKFVIRRVAPTKARPHGLSYSFTLNAPDGKRLVGFDNAHARSGRGSRFKARPIAANHWHQTAADEGRPYAFVSADRLLEDFFREVRRTLAEYDVSDNVVRVDEGKRP